MSKTHRCIDCALGVEVHADELCPSCGRCADHCQEDNHMPLERVEFKLVGEGEHAKYVPKNKGE